MDGGFAPMQKGGRLLMEMREKTVKALEKAIQCFERYSGDEYGREYNYTHVEVEVLEDAVALLKEDERAIEFQSDRLDALLKAQEPKLVAREVKRVLQDDSYDVATYADEVFYNCPKCGKRFSRYRPAKDIKYCSECGQAVKWE